MKGKRGIQVLYAKQMRDFRKENNIRQNDPLWWMIETAAQLEELRSNLRGWTRTDRIKAETGQPVPSTFYAVEFVISNPIKLDYVGKKRPGTFHHKIIAATREEATQLLIERLTKERGLDRIVHTPPSEEPQVAEQNGDSESEVA